MAQAFGPQVEGKQASLVGKVHRHRRRAVAQLEVSVRRLERFLDPPGDGQGAPRVTHSARYTAPDSQSRRILARDIDVPKRTIWLSALDVESWLMAANQFELAKLRGQFVTHDFPHQPIGVARDPAL